ncbi:hypothetical protein EVAR_81059_1 [Eumeta japonica]|uniref:Uncharacterized protein n=1 Tax=Eumeta variegata TaxID=151549 RepID=A0A4C1T6L4_EUMVA|nr:hypothetical protein EVAR_81059_1 [Eumeta japonica]
MKFILVKYRCSTKPAGNEEKSQGRHDYFNAAVQQHRRYEYFFMQAPFISFGRPDRRGAVRDPYYTSCTKSDCDRVASPVCKHASRCPPSRVAAWLRASPSTRKAPCSISRG